MRHKKKPALSKNRSISVTPITRDRSGEHQPRSECGGSATPVASTSPSSLTDPVVLLALLPVLFPYVRLFFSLFMPNTISPPDY